MVGKVVQVVQVGKVMQVVQVGKVVQVHEGCASRAGPRRSCRSIKVGQVVI